jgi:adenine-specific DNA-methyltransferase
LILFSVIWDSDRVNKPAFDIVVLRLAIVKLLMEIIESINGLSIGAIAPNSVINADCLEAMKLIPDKSIDLILCDPPYYKMKEEKWDRQWKTATDFLNWLDAIAEQWQRILKPNGSLYCFASAKMSSQVEMKLAERFNVINRLTWIKSDIDVNAGGIHRLINKKTLTSFYPNTESIIFCEHRRENSFAKIYDAKCAIATSPRSY